MPVLYLLHFNHRYPNGRRPQHYMGVAADLDKRVREHRAGNPGKGGSLTRALKVHGIEFVVARVWEFGTADEAFAMEKRIKKAHHHRRHCPVCRFARGEPDGTKGS